MNPKNLGVNFLDKWAFEYKFKREPKEWTLEQIHNLYLKAKERSEKRSSEFTKHINKIFEQVEPNKNGTYEVYFNRGGYVCKYQVNKPDWSDWSYSTGRVEFSKDVARGREEKINFILSKELQFELGTEMRKLEKMRSHFHLHVFHILEDSVNEKLNKKYKGVKNHKVPKVLKVNIGGTIHYVALDKDSRNHSYDYKRFEILGVEDNDVIELN
jgi:hypothetical protein